jgi:DNA-binding transcriptional MerR regulator
MDSKPLNNGSWRVGELAKAAGVSTDTLRHYERKGVLPRPHRSRNGYREYPEEALERVRTIRKALAVGFTLDELGAVFKVRDRGGVPCLEVRNLAAKKLIQLEVQLREMEALRDELGDSLQDWDLRLSKTPSGERAELLKALSGRNAGRTPSTALPFRKRNLEKKGKKNE